MSSAIERMIDILNRQRDQQAALVALSQRKVRAITDGDVTALQTITDGELETLGRISAIESEQSACVDELSQELVVPVNDVCMSLLIDRAEPDQSRRLKTLRQELTALIDQQSRYNETNMRLLEMNMQYVEFMINTSRGEKARPTYSATADVETAGAVTRRLLDRKV